MACQHEKVLSNLGWGADLAHVSASSLLLHGSVCFFRTGGGGGLLFPLH